MRLKSLFLLVIALSFFSIDAQSQLLKKLKRAASEGVGRAVEKTVSNEMEKATQRQLEKAFRNLYGDGAGGDGEPGSGQDGTTNGGSYDFGKIMGSINMNVDTESEYSFSGVAVMEIKSTNKKGKEEDPVIFNSFLSENPDYFGMEFVDPDGRNSNEKSIIIMDHKNKATIMLMENDNQKSSMAFGMDWGGMMDSYSDSTTNNASIHNMTFEKTGNTKDIQGYSCEEFRMNSEDSEGTYWISKDPIEGLEGFWSKNSPFVTKKMKEQNNSFFGNLPEGNIMEMTILNKEDEISSEMNIIEIDNSQSTTFDLADYPNSIKAAQ